MSKDKVKKAVKDFVYNVSMEGLAYALQNYPPGEDCPKDLKLAARKAVKAIDHVECLVNEYMEEYDLEWL